MCIYIYIYICVCVCECLIAGVELLDCNYRVVGSLLLLWLYHYFRDNSWFSWNIG